MEIVPTAARMALECIGNSDALYHNIEHTMLVTLAGHDIFRGLALHTNVNVDDYAHTIIACLTHDIGYVRGLLKGDDADSFVIDATGKKVSLPRGSSDAALMPYHVDRSKLYVMDRVEGIAPLDRERIARAIEGTRFPSDIASDDEGPEGREASIVRAADFIGQLGDPNYIRKANALYYEFEETGMNRQLGYNSPADIVNRYPQFYWNSVAPHVQTAIRLSQHDVERPPVDRQSLWQCIPCRARDQVVRSAKLDQSKAEPADQAETLSAGRRVVARVDRSQSPANLAAAHGIV